jgi:DNA-binding LacI/PurR family transcriptional regulator
MPASATTTISRSLRQRIKSGQWRGGFQISEDHVAREFQVCRSTAGKSLKTLEAEGLIWSRKGKGRFVQEAAQRRTGQIGVVLLDMRHLEYPITARAVAGIQSVLAESGDHLKLSALNERAMASGATPSARAEAALAAIEPAGLDAVILVALQAPILLVERLLEHLPVVWLHSSLCRPGLVGVKTDAIAAAFSATKQLLELGHRRIVLVNAPPPTSQVYREIWDGYRLAMGDAAAPVLPCDTEASDARRQVEQALDQPGRPTAFLCGSDELAMEVYKAAAARGLGVPRDLSIMGWHDATVHRPAPLVWSGVNVNYWQMGRIAAEQTLNLRDHPRHSGVVQMEATLASGQSVAPCP